MTNPAAIISSAAPQDPKPLAVPVKVGCRLLGIGATTMWALIKSGRIKTIRIGRRRLVVYRSLETLLSPAGES
jgi:excisionase family DNA binding protein